MARQKIQIQKIDGMWTAFEGERIHAQSPSHKAVLRLVSIATRPWPMCVCGHPATAHHDWYQGEDEEAGCQIMLNQHNRNNPGPKCLCTITFTQVCEAAS